MATEAFLSCLSRQALEREAAANQVRVEVRVKDTRARMVEHFTGKTWHYPGALFALTAQEAHGLQERAGEMPDDFDVGGPENGSGPDCAHDPSGDGNDLAADESAA